MRKSSTLPTLAAILIFAALTVQPGGAQGKFSWTVTFDGFPPIQPGSIIGIAHYFEQDVWFQAIGPLPSGPPYYLDRAGGGVAHFPENGSAYLLTGLGGSLALFNPWDRPFGVVSVDLAEFSTLYAEPLTVGFVGYRADGSSFTQEFVTDGIIDGTGPLPDFQTFYFDSRFANVVRVEVPSYGWALDNMVFSSVPEPSSFALLAVGAAMGLVFRRRRGSVQRFPPV